MKKKLLFINSSVSGGGAGHALINLLRGLDTISTHDVHVVIPQDGVVGEKLRQAGAKTIYEPLLPERLGRFNGNLPHFFRARWLEISLNILTFAILIWKIAKHVRVLGIDLIYGNHLIHMPIATGVGRLTGKPVVLHSREIFSNAIAKWYFSWVAKSNIVKRVICSSKGSSMNYLHTGKTTVALDHLDVAAHQTGVLRGQLKKTYDLGKEKHVIGFMGRVVKWKGIELLLRSFASICREHPEWVLAVVGGNNAGSRDDLLEEYKKLSIELGISERTLFTGFQKDPRQMAMDFDIFVLPSIDPEPFGMVTIEAMALGVPPLVSAHGGAVEIVRDGIDGLHFLPRSRKDLAQKMSQLMRDSKLRETLGAQAKNRVESSFDVSIGAKRISEVLNEVLKNEPPLSDKHVEAIEIHKSA